MRDPQPLRERPQSLGRGAGRGRRLGSWSCAEAPPACGTGAHRQVGRRIPGLLRDGVGTHHRPVVRMERSTGRL